MGYSSSRLTLYAILSAIEDDLRSLIRDHLGQVGDGAAVLGPELHKKTTERLNKDVGGAYPNPSLSELLPYIDYADSYKLLNAHSSNLPSQIAQYVKSITPRLDGLVAIRNRVSHGRPLNFDDVANAGDVADQLLSTQPVFWANLKQTREQLRVEPSFVLGLTIPAYEIDQQDRRHNLPQPDFDETGFLGRQQQVADVIRLCVGPYPVITLSGEGGIGKTALALKAAYDILDLPDTPFDAIVWTTSKTTTLTPTEIVKIKGAISDSLGVFQSIAAELAGQSSSEPIDEVLTYLEQFRILLILDNLETVLDEQIRSFLQRMPRGSKILLTSRVGLGAFEFPYKVPALQSGESVQLVRALAKVRGLNDLVRIPTKKLEGYCARMQNNPGWIKWFVSAVQAGKRPEEVLEKSDVFLEFCMSNVYKFLTAESKTVLQSMVAVPGAHSQAELAFLNKIDAVELQRCLQLLLTTNFVRMNSIPVGSSFESRYGISEMGREFLQKHHPPNPTKPSEFTRRKRQLIAASEQIKIEEKVNPFSYQSIVTRSPSDLIVARYLLDALRNCQREEYDLADKAIQTAKSLAPNYFEAHRIEAIVRVSEHNYSSARDAYERAIEYEPKSAPLRFWFGNFLVRYVDDLEEAVKQLREALRLAPSAPEVKMELARVEVYRSRFLEARELIDPLLNEIHLLSEWNRRKLFDLILSFYQRRADYSQMHRDSVAALSDLEELRRCFKAIPATTVDRRMRRKLDKSLPTAASCRDHSPTDDLRKRANEIFEWLSLAVGDEFADNSRSLAVFETGTSIGTVALLRGAFGFIDGEDGVRRFFHRRSLKRRNDWARLRSGTRVRFCAGTDEKGRPEAGEIEVLAEATTSAR